MTPDDFDAFKGELKQLCASLGKTYSDALGKAYWRVLRDVELSEIEANVERILLTAGKETKFPKPIDLRTTPTKIAMQGQDAATRLAQQAWDEKFRRDPRLAQIDLRYHQYQRVIASAHESSPEHAMALQASFAIIREHGNPRFFDYGA